MKRLLIIVVFAFVSSQAYGQEMAKPDAIKFECRTEQTQSRFFPEIQAAARRLNQAVCDALSLPVRATIPNVFPDGELPKYGIFVKEKAGLKFRNITSAAMTTFNSKLNVQLEYFDKTLQTGSRYPSFAAERGDLPGADGTFYFDGNQEKAGTVTAVQEDVCRERLQEPCSEVLDDLALAINPYQINVNAFSAYETRQKLAILAKDWDAYFVTGRAQSFADITLTTVFERKHFEKGFLVGPPARQWFVLHPNIVAEYASGAPSGERLRSALVIEWFGVNWWHDTVIKIPFGISVASLYSDRPGVKGVGHGFTIYVDNKYSIGYANHDGENGYYISFDLLKLFEDKKKQAERYQDQIKKL